MDEMDGGKLLRILLSRDKGARVIIMSACEIEDEEITGASFIRIGALAFIRKGSGSEAFSKAIREALKLS